MHDPNRTGALVGLGLLRRTAGGGVAVDGEVTTFCAVLVLADGAVAWQPADLSRCSIEQRRILAAKLRQQLRLLEPAGGGR